MFFDVFADTIAVEFGRENKSENDDPDKKGSEENGTWIVYLQCLPSQTK